MDDVGWGDFGCYGGGVAVGAPTPNIDRLARRGPAADVVLLGAVVHAVAGVAPDRPAADAPRPPAPADVRRAGRAAGRDHARRSSSPTPATSTQAVGKWHLGENVESPAPERRLRRLLRVPLACRTCTPSGATRTSSPRSSTARPAPSGSRTCRSTSASCTPTRGGELEDGRGGHDPGALAARRQVGRLLERLHPAHGRRATQPWFLLPRHPRRPLRQLPARALPRVVTGQAPLQGHDRRARRHRRPARRTCSRRPGQLEDTLVFLSSDNGPEMETWPDAAYTPFRCAKGSTWEGGVRVPGDRRRGRG